MSLPRAVLIGGNHLTNQLIAQGCLPDQQESFEQVLHDFDELCADMWICWKAIMDNRSDA